MINQLKKMGSVFLVLVLSIVFTSEVKAAEVCEKHQDYYFFIEINAVETWDTYLSGGSVWERSHKTYFPALPKDRIDFKESRICLKRDDSDNLSCDGYEGPIWTLEQFYTAYELAANSTDVRTFTISGTDSETSSKVYTTTGSDGTVIRYYTHGKWYAIDGSELIEGGESVDLSSSSVDAMSKASLLPHITEITMAFSETDNNSYQSLSGRVDRTIDASHNNNSSVVPFSVVWTVENVPTDSILAPSLYYVEYDTCSEKYNATIDYYYEGTTDRVEFDNNEPNPWTQTGLEDGYSTSVTSPSKEGCTPDQSRVDFTIQGADYHGVVYYTCEVEEVPDNPPTGDTVIGAVIVIGIVALGYVLLYYTNRVKEEK